MSKNPIVTTTAGDITHDVLADDFDDLTLSSRVGGTLCFTDGSVADGLSTQKESETSKTIKTWSKSSGNGNPLLSDTCSSPKKGSQRVTFEIVSAKTVLQGRRKHVSYTIIIKRIPGLERQPGVLERRYSDFLLLFQALRTRYPALLTEFPFPKKALVGNFTAEVIAERSVAFHHLLTYAFSVKELRQTPELADFLYNRELREAHKLMKTGHFEDASVILENIFFVQEKLLGESSWPVFSTLCFLVACLNAVDNITEAQKYAEIAICHMELYKNSEMSVPLLILSVRLWWAVGKDKRDLEEKLQEIKQGGLSIDKLPTLLEFVLKQDNLQPMLF
ncbi:sorting nexin 21 [Tachypleus tridentatus]|uniref:sorting nexin 21 n=1 Tax=Tachypleus tridentatus TaxID=6853 RepID=UPI003FD0E975